MNCFLFFICLSNFTSGYSPQVGTDEENLEAKHSQVSIQKKVQHWSNHFKLPIALVQGVIKKESNWDFKATSYANAKGLMQLMEPTAQWLGKGVDESLYNPDTNIYYGCKYLRYLLDKFDGNESYALMAYYAGPSVVDGQRVTYVHKLKLESAQYSHGVLLNSLLYLGKMLLGTAQVI